MLSKEELERSVQSIDQSLGKIEYILAQMLALARLSASDINIDRATLQKTLEHLAKLTASRTKFDALSCFPSCCTARAEVYKGSRKRRHANALRIFTGSI